MLKYCNALGRVLRARVAGNAHRVDDVRGSLVDRGVNWVQQFTWEQTARKTLAVYEQITGVHLGADRHYCSSQADCLTPWDAVMASSRRRSAGVLPASARCGRRWLYSCSHCRSICDRWRGLRKVSRRLNPPRGSGGCARLSRCFQGTGGGWAGGRSRGRGGAG